MHCSLLSFIVHNYYVLTQKKIGDTISAHVRLKEILNNIMNIILYLQAFKLQLPIGYLWKK